MLVRADLNVPLAGGEVSDDTRIRAALPTLELLRERGASMVLVLAPRPAEGPRAGAVDERRWRSASGSCSTSRSTLADGVVGDPVGAQAEALAAGELLLLENSRFEPGETKNDPELAARLAELAELYVNDAFGAAHRAHAQHGRGRPPPARPTPVCCSSARFAS